jgi:AraC-like DNA-binding protein
MSGGTGAQLMTMAEFLTVRGDTAGGTAPDNADRGGFARQPIEPQLGEGYCDAVWLAEDLFAYIADGQMHQDLSETMDGDGWGAFHVRLRGRSTDSIGRTTRIERQPGTFATVVYPRGVERTETHLARERFCSLAVAFRPSALHALGLGDTSGFPQTLRDFIAGRPADFFYQAAPLTAPLAAVARDVIATDLTGRLRRLYIEAKAMELVCIALQQLATSAANDARMQVRISPADQERLRAVKAHVDAASGDIPDLARLGRMFSLNRNKLVYGFKAMFGHGVFEYSRQCRLEYARSLLLDSCESITDIALRAGYEHPSSFTRAFQLQFGHSPRCARNSKVTRGKQ